ncbi:MAG: DUF4126 family protein [Acidobacteria bacterium]|nr:DUF4126 family protein [Acidobacteriota bacterium]
MNKKQKAWRNTIALGAMAGMRSMSAPAAVSRQLSRRRFHWPRGKVESLLSEESASNLLLAAAAAEMLADKLPFVPNRIRLLPLAGRAAGGAVAGWALGRRDSRVVLASVGAATAIATAFVTFYLRTTIVKRSRIPDTLLGLAEDAVVLAIANEVKL